MADEFDINDAKKPRAFVQWKGTDVCMDFYCDCGAHCHFDGYFADAVKCPHCTAEWEMPWNLYPRRLDRGSDSGKWHDPKMMEPDESHSDEVEDEEGTTRIVARPLAPTETA